MELRELKYFLAVAREESISRAAEAMYVTQPNLSRQMKNLENEIGKPLFERGSRKITLTETGKLLKKRAEELFELYDRTESELKAPLDKVSGEVKIGGGESRAFTLIARAICAVQQQYPSVRFDIYSGDSEAVGDKLDKGLIDFGVFIEPTNISRYDSLKLPVRDRWGVIMRKDCPLAQKDGVTADDLKGLPLIRSRHSLADDEISQKLGGNKNIVTTYNLLYNASLLAESGVGYAVSIDGLINTEGSELCFRPFVPEIKSDLNLAWKKYRMFSPAAEVFLNEIKKLIIV